jgi:hypothetical protein
VPLNRVRQKAAWGCEPVHSPVIFRATRGRRQVRLRAPSCRRSIGRPTPRRITSQCVADQPSARSRRLSDIPAARLRRTPPIAAQPPLAAAPSMVRACTCCPPCARRSAARRADGGAGRLGALRRRRYPRATHPVRLSIVALRRTPGPGRPPAGIRHRDTDHPLGAVLFVFPGVSGCRPTEHRRTPPNASAAATCGRNPASRHRPSHSVPFFL